MLLWAPLPVWLLIMKMDLKEQRCLLIKATDEGKNKIIIAIDKLSATYNTVKPKNKDK
ncbi:hypothetical protein [Borreliella bavariensis]|uniref:hypothetical protein n=1 Tax=Borreliella bavariensis TaxID=664662 RepID=UPI001F2CB1D9|nr:hypothetical protein [Borreliella bavariensis]